MDKAVKQVAEVAEQHGHGVPYKSSHAAEQKQNIAQNAQFNRDMKRVEKLHRRGQK
jgi:hypothetical protein